MKTMTIVTALVGICISAGACHRAEARPIHHRHHASAHHHHHKAKPRRIAADAISATGGTHHRGGGLITVPSAAGPVTVAPAFAEKIVPFIADVVARGFRGRVHCHASGGHVSGSLHYRGEACDFAQSGWGKTVAPMYDVADLTARYGLRDGCTFLDCGHIDSGARLARAHPRSRGVAVASAPSAYQFVAHAVY